MAADNYNNSLSSAPQTSNPGLVNMALSTPEVPQQYPFIPDPRRQRNIIPRGMYQLPELPAFPTSMESTKSDPSHLYPGMPQQEQHQYQQDEVLSLLPEDVPTLGNDLFSWNPGPLTNSDQSTYPLFPGIPVSSEISRSHTPWSPFALAGYLK